MESFEFPYGKAAKKEQENKVDDANIESDNLRAEQNSSSPVVKEDKPVENVANTDVSANDNAEKLQAGQADCRRQDGKEQGEKLSTSLLPVLIEKKRQISRRLSSTIILRTT